MKEITFRCDSCASALPIAPNEAGAVGRNDYRHYAVTVIPKSVHAVPVPQGHGSPAHEASGHGVTYQIDLCVGCAEQKTLSEILGRLKS